MGITDNTNKDEKRNFGQKQEAFTSRFRQIMEQKRK